MSGLFTVYGPEGSSYVRSVRLALQEKGVPYELKEEPLTAYKEEPYLSERHPFGKVPAAEHDGFRFYETQAILRYIDEVFPGVPLQPSDLRQRARMNQIIGIHDAYFWPSAAPGIVMNRVSAQAMGIAPDEAAIAAALPRTTLSMREFDRLMGDLPFLASERLTLADLIVFPLVQYVARTPEGEAILAELPRLKRWMARMAERSAARQIAEAA